jgi:hypothetical protein
MRVTQSKGKNKMDEGHEVKPVAPAPPLLALLNLCLVPVNGRDLFVYTPKGFARLYGAAAAICNMLSRTCVQALDEHRDLYSSSHPPLLWSALNHYNAAASTNDAHCLMSHRQCSETFTNLG